MSLAWIALDFYMERSEQRAVIEYGTRRRAHHSSIWSGMSYFRILPNNVVFGVCSTCAPGKSSVFYIGTNDPAELEAIRKHALTTFSQLPISGEYLHRDAFDVARKYGKDTFLAIRMFGTPRIPALFALKSKIDLLIDGLGFFPTNFTDRVLQALSQLFPEHLPTRMREFRDKYEPPAPQGRGKPGERDASLSGRLLPFRYRWLLHLHRR